MGGSQGLLPFRFDYLLQQLVELREILAYVYQFLKGQDADEELLRVGLGGSRVRELLSLRGWVCYVHVFPHLDALPTLYTIRILWRLLHICKIGH